MHSGVQWLVVVFTGGPLAAASTSLLTRERPLGPALRDRACHEPWPLQRPARYIQVVGRAAAG